MDPSRAPSAGRRRPFLLALLASTALLLACLPSSPALASNPCDAPVPPPSCGDGPGPICTVLNLVPPSLPEDPRVGVASTVSPGTWTTGATLAYQWRVNGTAVAGATGTSYTPVPSDLNKAVTVVVTGTKLLCEPATATTAPRTVQTGPAPSLTGLKLTGLPQSGNILTLTEGTLSPACTATRTYSWRRGTVLVTGITGASYPLTTADVGSQITGTVEVRCPGRATTTASVKSVMIVSTDTLAVVTPPTLSGPPTLGSTLTVASFGTWNPVATSYTAQWLRDGVPVGAASSTASITIGPDDVGSEIAVRVIAGATGYWNGTTTVSAGFVPLGDAPVAEVAPTIDGTPRVGEVLHVSDGSWDVPVDAHAYVWTRDGEVVEQATGASYLLTGADAGATVTATVLASATGHATGSATAAGVTVEPGPAITPTVAPSVAGSARYGSTLTAVPGSWSQGGATFRYQWARDGRPVAGATASTYRLGASDVGTEVTVVVTAHVLGYADGTARASAGRVTSLGALKAKKKLRIKGKHKVKKTVRASLGKKKAKAAFAPRATKVSYQWYRGKKAIKKATKRTYTVKKKDRGKKLRVRVTGTAPGHDAGVLTSPAFKVRRR